MLTSFLWELEILEVEMTGGCCYSLKKQNRTSCQGELGVILLRYHEIPTFLIKQLRRMHPPSGAILFVWGGSTIMGVSQLQLCEFQDYER